MLSTDWAKDAIVSYLAHTMVRLGYQLFAYVVMEDHVHLLLRLDIDVATVRRILSALKTRTASVVLDRLRLEDPELVAKATSSKRAAHLWQPGGGYDRNIFSREEFLEKAKYIEENPVRKGLAARAEDYPWSSAGSPALGRDPRQAP